ncbi:hypothetical protein [Novosphingobium gossypii]|uniref:hypothetical protein n=1 Tax=Novosphingobium gossypii TaxID=1604774 RepID=UPI003D20B06F
MSLALSHDDAIGGTVSPDLARLSLLAEEVKAAQEHRRRAGEDLILAQKRLRNATTQAEAAESRFRDACPAAFGIADRSVNMHPVEQWLARRCSTSYRLAVTRSSSLYRDFMEWAVGTGLPQCELDRWSQTRFGRELTDRGFAPIKDRSGLSNRRGIRLRGEPDHA